MVLFFYSALTALSALLMWTLRPKHSNWVVWVLLFCLSAGLGFSSHVQISQFQQRLEAQVIAMLGDLTIGAIDPGENTTRMGSVGKLKLSSKIAFRIAPTPKMALQGEPKEELKKESKKEPKRHLEIKPAHPPTSTSDEKAADIFPLLLREATYNQYQLSSWTATNSLFETVPPRTTEGEWLLSSPQRQVTTITISDDLERGDGVLPLPQGTTMIRQLPVAEMQQNQYGAVQVDATGNAAYTVDFNITDVDAEQGIQAPPTATDLQIPQADKAAIETTLKRLAIAGKPERERVSQIAAYFQDFQYSLDLLRPDAATTPISDFLLHIQAGHCEYFASATTLLLRGAGIPARYAVGYLAHEFSPLEAALSRSLIDSLIIS
ncbi:MAG: transglutaminase domain-containing protein [Phormidesmis sp. RL_2_1]|nr:transglutaminase domain-containing protein [Phormidesmis sp. RL_2_1]